MAALPTAPWAPGRACPGSRRPWEVWALFSKMPQTFWPLIPALDEALRFWWVHGALGGAKSIRVDEGRFEWEKAREKKRPALDFKWTKSSGSRRLI